MDQVIGDCCRQDNEVIRRCVSCVCVCGTVRQSETDRQSLRDTDGGGDEPILRKEGQTCDTYYIMDCHRQCPPVFQTSLML